MNARITSLVVALLIIVGAGLVGWNQGWFSSNEPYIATEPSAMPTSTAVVSSSGDIRVTAPVSGSILDGRFDVTGEARGQWYFEASFPIQVRTPDGVIIAQAPAQAQGDWMTEDFVPFMLHLDVTAASSTFHGPALLILLRDNPSGLPENDDSVTVPVVIR